MTLHCDELKFDLRLENNELEGKDEKVWISKQSIIYKVWMLTLFKTCFTNDWIINQSDCLL